jgi:hypothetical protein
MTNHELTISELRKKQLTKQLTPEIKRFLIPNKINEYLLINNFILVRYALYL